MQIFASTTLSLLSSSLSAIFALFYQCFLSTILSFILYIYISLNLSSFHYNVLQYQNGFIAAKRSSYYGKGRNVHLGA